MSALTTNQPAVIDLGTGLTKAGFAGTPTPTAVLGTVVARPTLPRVLPSAQTTRQNAPLVGDEIAALAGVVKVTHPLSRGSVADAPDATAVISHVTEDLLQLAQGQHPVLVTENACNARRNRELLAEIFFETCQVPSLYIAVPGVLALYAAGRTTGVVLDVGDGVTTALPIARGYLATHAIGRVDLGGRDVSERLAGLLRGSGTTLFASSSEKDAVRKIKERECIVARDLKAEEARWKRGELESRAYELPDGNVVELGPERFRAAELLFNPALGGSEYAGVHGVVHQAVQGVDPVLRKEMYSAVVLAGGASKTRGFAQRLVDELRPLPPPNTKIRVHAPPDRLISAYTGGSILASLSTFRSMAFSATDYYERGENVVHRAL